MKPSPWLDAITGKNETQPLRHLIFNLALFLTWTVIAGYFALDLVLHFSPFEFFVESILLVILGVLYLASRFWGGRGVAVHLASVVGLLFVIVNFFTNGGYEGSGWVSALMVLTLVAVFHTFWSSLFYGVAVVVVQLGCVGVAEAYPQWVTRYLTPQQQTLDLVFSFAFCTLLLFGALSLVMRFYADSQRRTNEAVRRASRTEERLRLAIEASKDGHWDWDLTTDEVYYSPRWKQILGYSDEELPTRKTIARELAAPGEWDRVLAYYDEQRKAGAEREEIEFQMLHKDGSRVEVLARTRLVRNAAGTVIRLSGTHTDITEKNRAIHELREARAEAERANAAKSSFLSSMSHELRTPMNAILGFGQVLSRDPTLSPGVRDYLEEILKAGRQLLELIDEVLDLARIENGKMYLSPATLDGQELLTECLREGERPASERGILLTSEPGDPLAVVADRTRLKHVLLTLVTTAIRAAEPHSSVSLQCQRRGGKVRLAVTAPELPSDKFQAMVVQLAGSGIGLAFQRRLAGLMDGTLGIERTDEGTTILWVELPGKESSQLLVDPRLRIRQVELPETYAPRTVLYVEDNASNRKLVSQVLASRKTMELVTAETGAQALELAQRLRPALILLDLNLPGMDGYQVLDSLRAQPWGSDIPVVAVTANAMTHDWERARQAGFAAYVTKPLNLLRFEEVIDALLGREAEDA